MAVLFVNMSLTGKTKGFNVYLAFVLISTFAEAFLVQEQLESVSLHYGTLHGKHTIVQFKNQSYQVGTFLGIPYAEPPVGDLRLQKPVPISTFTTSPFDANSYGPACPGSAPDIPQSEDCLTLNIFRPSSQDGMKLRDLPVMVWIHGGGFVIGTSRLYDGRNLSAYTGMIVVTMNYRLGPLGFFSFEDDVAPGNYGLWDQHLAIKWVRDNIVNFGGNPETITIFGESAGSSSVIYQLLYAGNDGLFKRAIAESGTINTWSIGIKGDTSKASKRFASQFNCNSSSEVGILSCMRSVSPDAIAAKIQFETIFAEYDELNLPWLPVYDNSFVQSETSTLIGNMTKFPDRFQVFHKTELLIGNTNYDGLLKADMYRKLINASNIVDLQITQGEYKDICAPRLAKMFFKRSVAPLTVLAVLNDYINWGNPTNATQLLDGLARMTTDAIVRVPTVLTADAHAGGNSKTYLYEFAATPAFRGLPVPSLLESQYTANHGDDVAFVFGFNGRESNASAAVLNLTKAVMTMWSNFAKSG